MKTLLVLSFVSLVLAACSVEVESSPTLYTAPPDAQINLRSDIVFMTLSDLARQVRAGQLSSAEVVDAFLSQIYASNPQLNALVMVNEAEARAAAVAADEAFARGEIWGPLHGVPIVIKEQIAVRGMRSTSGYPALKHMTTDYDAPVVERLKEAGAIILGKTNMAYLAIDFQTQNPIYGRTNNPWALERTPGGSSGGDAAAVAAGLAPLGIGTDMEGSIRIPAHYNGVIGLKPTEGLVPTFWGTSPGLTELWGADFTAARHRATVGPIARSIEDLKLVLPIIAGAHPKAVDVPDIPIIYPEPKPVQSLRVGWIKQFNNIPISQDTRHAMAAFVEKLSDRGVEVIEVQLSDLGVSYRELESLNRRLAYAELVVYLPRIARYMLEFTLEEEHKLDPLSYENYLRLMTTRDELIGAFMSNAAAYDVLLVPVSSTPAFEHLKLIGYGEGTIEYEDPIIYVDDQAVDYMKASSAYTSVFNALGNPIVTMPIGFSEDELPIGIQVVGSRWRDADLLVVADQLFEIGGALKHPPGYESKRHAVSQGIHH